MAYPVRKKFPGGRATIDVCGITGQRDTDGFATKAKKTSIFIAESGIKNKIKPLN
jgi:hypothetical protein